MCKIIGIEYPIFGLSHATDVVAAITNCGGLGVYGAARDVPEEIAPKLALVRSAAGNRPYGVDVIVPRVGQKRRDRNEVEAQIPAAHREFVAAIGRKYGVPKATRPGYRSRLLRSDELWEAQFEATLLSDAEVFVCGAGISRDFVTRAKVAGKLAFAVVGAPKHARLAMDAGVDAIVAQGADAGGHTGTIGTMTLVPQIVDMAGDIPVLAAGGIGCGRQIAASLALGAQGVWLGTLWLATVEQRLGNALLQKLLAATSEDTVVTRASSGKTMRQIRSAWSSEWSSADAPAPLGMPYQDMLVGELISAIDEYQIEPLVHEAAGQSVAWCKELTTVQSVFHRLLEETDRAFFALNAS